MLPVSQLFLDAIRGSHSVVSRVVVLDPPGQTGANPSGRTLAVVTGAVTLDGRAAIRASLDLEVRELWPNTNTTNDLVPYGTELAVSRGIRYSVASSESAPLGIFRVTDSEQSEAPSGNIRITASDRMGVVIDSNLLAPRYYATGTSYASIFTQLIQTDLGLPAVQWDATDGTGSGKLLERGLVCERDRFKFLDDLVKGLGKIWYFDYLGVPVVRTASSTVIPVWDVNGGSKGVLTRANRRLTRQGVANAIVVRGEGLDVLPPPTWVEYDLDPQSATFWNGPFGRVPDEISGPSITNIGQAQIAARAELEQRKGLPYRADFSQVPNPALEPFDPVTVTYPLDRFQSPHIRVEYHVLDRIVVGLGASEVQTADTRLTSNRGALA